MARKTNPMWQPAIDALARGEAPKVFINAQGNVCLDDGNTGPVMPAWLAAQMPADVVAEAKARQAQHAAEAAQRGRELAAEIKRGREALLASVDLARCTLIAGEASAVVARGTHADCLAALHKVRRLPVDEGVGRGCWVIVAPHRESGDPVEIEAGQFDREMAW